MSVVRNRSEEVAGDSKREVVGGNNIQNPDPEVSTEVEGDTRKDF